MKGSKRYSRDIALGGVVLVDAVFFLAASIAGFYVRLGSGWFDRGELVCGPREVLSYSNHFVFGLVLFIFLGIYLGLYSDVKRLRLRYCGSRIFKTCLYWLVVYLFICLVFRLNPEISRWYVILTTGLAAFSVIFGRYFYFKFLVRRGWIDRIAQRMLFVGRTEQLSDLIDAINEDELHPYQAIGWVQTRGVSETEGFKNLECLGMMDDLEDVIDSTEPDVIVLADMEIGKEKTDALVHLCARESIDFKWGGTIFPVFASGLKVQTISGIPLLGVQELPIEVWYSRFIKRAMDLAGALVGLVISMPCILICGFLVQRESPGPVFYRQVRSGRWGKPFEIIKIRSMSLDAEKEGVGWSTPEDGRRLKIGKFMRKWNLDELPQFWNVLKGEMSLVGPRPERPELIEDFKYKIRLYNIRHGVKPGLTGWAQVNGWRGDTDLEERIRHDLYYMENWSIWLDIQILLLTLVRYKNAH